MATVIDRPPPAAPEQGMSRREQWAIVFFGTWVTTGLYLDGWAHITELPETFFTPWHLVLYSGFVAAVAWFSIDGMRRSGLRAVAENDDRFAGWGLAVFIAGAVGDFAWHEIFGFEEDLEALLSPTHLALMFGGVLMLSGPLRAAWTTVDERSPGWRAFFPVAMSALLVTAVVSFFAMFLSPFRFSGVFTRGEGFVAETVDILAVASVLTGNAILLAVTFVLVRRWVTPFGTFALIYTTVASGMVAMNGFFAWQNIPVALAGGIAADVMARRVGADWRAARWLGIVTPLVLWSSWFVGLWAMHGVGWAAELVVGTILLAAGSGWTLAILSFPRPHARPSSGVEIAVAQHERG